MSVSDNTSPSRCLRLLSSKSLDDLESRFTKNQFRSKQRTIAVTGWRPLGRKRHKRSQPELWTRSLECSPGEGEGCALLPQGGLVRKAKTEKSSFACVPANTFLAAGALLAAKTKEKTAPGSRGTARP